MSPAEIFNEVNGAGLPGRIWRQQGGRREVAEVQKTARRGIGFPEKSGIRASGFRWTPAHHRFIRRSCRATAQVWTFHSYYLWSVYRVFEQNLVGGSEDLADPATYAPIRRFLRRDLVPFQAILDSREGRPSHCSRLVPADLAVSQPRPERHAGTGANAGGEPAEAYRRVQTGRHPRGRASGGNCVTSFCPRPAHSWRRRQLLVDRSVSAGRSARTPTGKWSNTRPAYREHGLWGRRSADQLPGRKTRSGTNTPSACGESTPCFWATQTENATDSCVGGAVFGNYKEAFLLRFGLGSPWYRPRAATTATQTEGALRGRLVVAQTSLHRD